MLNGDAKGIWSLTMIDGEDKEEGKSCVFVERGEMKEPKCLHNVYRPKHQNFFVLFGGEK